MAKRVHELVTTSAPAFVPRTYYGMPAYSRDGKTICFFKPAVEVQGALLHVRLRAARQIDDGDMWPVAFDLTKLTPAVEKRIVELVKKAAG